MSDIIYDGEGQIGLITFNRPKVLNAITMNLVREFSALLDDVAISDLRCLIITGAGNKAFAAGADISEMRNFTRRQGAELCELGNAVMRKIESLPIPVIAAVNGFALGGGFEIALSCDLRLASENAVFGLPELNPLPAEAGRFLLRLKSQFRLKPVAMRLKPAEATAHRRLCGTHHREAYPGVQCNP